MNTGRTPHPSTGFLVRNHVELLTAFAVLFILQAGMVPFDFNSPGAPARPRIFFDASMTTFTYPDAVSNLFLYVPLGLLLHWSLCRRRMTRAAAMLTTLIFAAVISGGIEWVQAHSPSRVSSRIDLLCNLAGAVLGASISSIGGWIVPRLAGAALFEFHKRPAAALVKSYCALLVVCAALPFSFSFDASRIKKALKASVFVPFGAAAEAPYTHELAGAADHHRAAALARWAQMRRWSRWAAEAASFLVLAWLVRGLLRSDYGFQRRAASALVWWLCGLFAVALSVLQFPIVSRGCDVTDILFRFLGIGGGLFTRSMFLPPREGSTDAALKQRTRQLAGFGCAATALYIVYTGVIPMTFADPEGGVWGPLTTSAFLPFMAYFVTRFDLMMTDVMEKFAAYALLAALLAACWMPAARLGVWPRLIRVSIVCIVLSSLIECAQMFIAIRVVSLTDPILAAVGCMVGVVIQEHAVRFYRFSASREALALHDGLPMPGRVPGMTITDSLIASLSEPDPNAPREHSPAPADLPS